MRVSLRTRFHYEICGRGVGHCRLAQDYKPQIETFGNESVTRVQVSACWVSLSPLTIFLLRLLFVSVIY
jgi:hypothetical protein